MSASTPPDEIARIYRAQRGRAPEVARTTASERIAKIRKLRDAVMAQRDGIRAAMWSDFRKPAAEVDLSEVFIVTTEAQHAMKHLGGWMKPRRVPTPITLLGATSRVIHEPKGVVLLISPWNFPYNLTLGPLVSAVAAGNCVMIKPSEMTPASTAQMKKMLGAIFDESEVAIIEGDATVAAQLLQLKFDHIFFTGSPSVGKLVMKAAADHLTSVTLELGGKSPVIVDRTADLDEAAGKVAWGKFLNSGQVCVAPDYILVDEAVREPFTAKLKSALVKLGGQTHRPVIVNERHAERLRRLLDETVAAGGTILCGGKIEGRNAEPTLVAGIDANAPIMKEEIFGPLLPILGYRSRSEAYGHVAAGEKPLALYVFSRDRAVVDEVLENTRAGSTAINHVVVQFFQPNLPFGGAGQSGIGRAHGFAGFEAFSNVRGVLDQRLKFASIQLMMPPYNALKQKIIDLTLRFF